MPAAKKDTGSRWILWTNIAIAIATISAAIFTGLTYSNSLFVSSTYYRPHVTQAGIVVAKNEKDKRLNFQLQYLNTGPIPAEDVQSEWKVFLNSDQQKSVKYPDGPHTLAPQQMVAMVGAINGERYLAVMNETSTLVIVFEVTYKDAGGQVHHFHEKSRYLVENNAFMAVESTSN